MLYARFCSKPARLFYGALSSGAQTVRGLWLADPRLLASCVGLGPVPFEVAEVVSMALVVPGQGLASLSGGPDRSAGVGLARIWCRTDADSSLAVFTRSTLAVSTETLDQVSSPGNLMFI